MQKLQDYWNERSSQQKMLMVGAFLATFLAITGFAMLANRPSLALLYAGLAPESAGEVVAGVERAGVPYEVRGDSIYVEASHRDRLRMELAAQGLPASGSAGYEILDGMSGFGTTSQMFDAAYWRAKEGELARTILALPNVKTARVHLAVAAQRGFRRDATGSASVTLTTTGTAITREQAAALKYLVSSGVPGMDPEKVTVIDSQRGVVQTGDDTSTSDRASEMKRNVERILEPHVGIGNAIVELNLDVITESEQLTEQKFNPQERALVSEVTEETSDQSNSKGAGAVTAASNLPEGDQQASDSTQASRSENRQQANYEVSSSTREVVKAPGAIRRLTVAVLVNGVPGEGNGTEGAIVPRGEAELETIRELVSSAVGFDPTRGDLITVKSLPFAALGQDGTSSEPAGLLERLAINDLAKLALIGFFALAVALVVLRPIMKSRSGGSAAAGAASGDLPALDDSLPPFPAPLPTATIELPDSLGGFDAPLIGQDFGGPTQLSLPHGDPVARLRGMMKERQDESMKILSSWIDKKENAL